MDKFFIADSDEAMTDGDDNKDRLLSGWNSLKKKDQDRFRVGRNGDDLLVSFKCDWRIPKAVPPKPKLRQRYTRF